MWQMGQNGRGEMDRGRDGRGRNGKKSWAKWEWAKWDWANWEHTPENIRFAGVMINRRDAAQHKRKQATEL